MLALTCTSAATFATAALANEDHDEKDLNHEAVHRERIDHFYIYRAKADHTHNHWYDYKGQNFTHLLTFLRSLYERQARLDQSYHSDHQHKSDLLFIVVVDKPENGQPDA